MATSVYPTLPSPPGGGKRIYLYKKSAVEEGHPVKLCCFEVCPILTRTTGSEIGECRNMREYAALP